MVSIISVVFGIFIPYFKMSTDIELIKQSIQNINANHETHIQDILQQIKDIQADQKVQNEKIQENSSALIKLLK